ncbi:hypothetical protein PFLUV_G00028280 [Perca fluviatilis]|uniref:Uncharacterized protein n=1 Tax=Perca fluviatilis TaxID=8168 RepID=A0A6A5FQ74_PERFL|nr:hypothetical protein PFLUV_G00028280 [Perca fluviatilis]
MNDATKEIVHFKLVQVTEASILVAMEVMGFQRGLNHLLTMGVAIGVVSTDRAPSIRKIMRETYNEIRHEFDAWHVNKSFKKKLVTAANKRENKELLTWLKSIIGQWCYWTLHKKNQMGGSRRTTHVPSCPSDNEQWRKR